MNTSVVFVDVVDVVDFVDSCMSRLNIPSLKADGRESCCAKGKKASMN